MDRPAVLYIKKTMFFFDRVQNFKLNIFDHDFFFVGKIYFRIVRKCNNNLRKYFVCRQKKSVKFGTFYLAPKNENFVKIVDFKGVSELISPGFPIISNSGMLLNGK